MSQYQRQLLRFPVGVNDSADLSLFSESRAAAMIGIGPAFQGFGTTIWWKKLVQLNASFPPSGQITGIFQYTADAIANDKIIVIKNGTFYSCTVSGNAPTLTPDALNFTSTQLVAITNNSGVSFNAANRVRAVQLGLEMFFVQDGGVTPVRYNGTAIYKLGISTPSAPTDGGNSAGGVMVSGATYQYAVTFQDELGRESSPSTALSVVMGAGGARVINWTGPTDTQVQRIYLYRTTANNTLFYRVVEAGFAVGTVTYTDSTVNDTNLTLNTTAPYPFENEPPQPASLISIYKFRLALNNVNDPRELQISNLDQPGSYSLIGPIYNSSGQLINATDGTTLRVLNEYGDEITGLGHLGSVLGVWNRRTTGIFEGDNPAQYQFQIMHRIGCIAPDSIQECGNSTVFLAEDGLYALDYQSGFSITRLSEDLDNLFRSVSVLFDPTGTWPPTTTFTRQARAAAAISTYLHNTYVLATPPYTICYDFDTSAFYMDFMTGMPYGDGSESKGYLSLSRIFADRQFQVGLYSPGYGVSSGALGDMYVMSPYPLTQSAAGVPEYNPFIYETRGIDGNGVHRTRIKRFKRVTLFGKILPGTKADGTVTADALINGTISLVMDDGYVFGPYDFDNLTQISTNYVGADFAKLAIQGKLICQELPPDCTGRIVQVLIIGQANGRLQISDLLTEYIPVDGD